MTQSASQPLPAPAAPRPNTIRTIVALMLREMSTTYGRSSLGYLWAILEPAAGIMLLSLVFATGFRSPSLGTNFALFFASGLLPFMAYQDVAQKISVALRFSKPLLFYPGVTFLDALIGRFLVNAITHVMIFALVLTAILQLYQVDVILDPMAIALGFSMALALGLGIGTLNCFLLSIFPVWERTWSILNRPLFIISCVIFLYDVVPNPYRDWLWWNPLIHVVGQIRKGIYSTYDAPYVSPLFVFSTALLLFTFGLLLLRRYHRDITNL